MKIDLKNGRKAFININYFYDYRVPIGTMIFEEYDDKNVVSQPNGSTFMSLELLDENDNKLGDFYGSAYCHPGDKRQEPDQFSRPMGKKICLEYIIQSAEDYLDKEDRLTLWLNVMPRSITKNWNIPV